MAHKVNDDALRPHEDDEPDRDSAGFWLDASQDATAERIAYGHHKPKKAPVTRSVAERDHMATPSVVDGVLEQWDAARGD